MKLARHLAISCSLLAVIFMTGCANSQTDSEPENIPEELPEPGEDSSEDLNGPKHNVVVNGKEQVSEYGQEQWDMYDDGDFTREDYEQAFLNFVACVEKNDGHVDFVDLDQETITYSMFVGADPDDYCYYTHFGLIDMHWQLGNPPDETDQIDFYIDCLTSHDIEPAHNEPITEPGDAQTEQLTDLEQQEDDNNIDCGYTDPALDDIPYND